ncbi:hypothetical protein LTR85_009704 [Meristemomyces frigidus]|nr:hypothetical protein LTR85_009704 [Meristemomyces frigidus]
MPPPLDTEVLIIGAGPSGLGTAIQLKRNNLTSSIEIIEKCGDVGGTWLVNTYPGCGCDVASHFYSYSFALNPDWSQKFSMRSEIQQYFRDVAERFDVAKHVRFHSTVETARWVEEAQYWEVTVKNQKTKETYVRRAKIVVSAVGSLSVPQKCEIPGADDFKGPLFHSALWDHSFDWKDKDVVVLGNGCSATQFVPIMAPNTKTLTQFARQAHFLAERPNPVYSDAFKTFMRYVPGAMRAYRFKLYADMEKDFAGFDIESGGKIRQGLKEENEKYVKKMAPEKYWDALIPKHEIGCKRKVMDTEYLATLHRSNVELIHDDPVDRITETGVRAKSGREVKADAIVLATGFEVSRMLFPMQIIGQGGVSLNEHWDTQHQGAAQAYMGTCVPGFPNFFTLMGPNTVTGHLSVIYTVECQINFILRLVEPILKSLHSPSRGLREITAVDVKPESATRHINWLQSRLSKLVWSSGCTSWALDPKTGLNIAMYPEYQFLFWLRSVFIPGKDFSYEITDRKGKHASKSLTVGGWKGVQQFATTVFVVGMLAAGALGVRRAGGIPQARGLDLFARMNLHRSPYSSPISSLDTLMGVKRSRTDMEGQPRSDAAAAPQRQSPFMPMFEQFRAELDEHHDRRERIIKASRDVTAASKKIIFTLQRIRNLNQALPQHAVKGNQQYHTTISTQLSSVSADLQGLNAYRYSRQISGGCQEWMEAVSFQHYIETATLLSYEDARKKIKELDPNGPGVELSAEDYVLGIYDMTGELMRFAITTMATSGSLPTIPSPQPTSDTAMDIDQPAPPTQRSLLTDMRALRSALESLDAGGGPFAKESEKKADVMRTSVEKVEKALYGLIVRGAERPKGWNPDAELGGGRTVEVEG